MGKASDKHSGPGGFTFRRMGGEKSEEYIRWGKAQWPSKEGREKDEVGDDGNQNTGIAFRGTKNKVEKALLVHAWEERDLGNKAPRGVAMEKPGRKTCPSRGTKKDALFPEHWGGSICLKKKRVLKIYINAKRG